MRGARYNLWIFVFIASQRIAIGGTEGALKKCLLQSLLAPSKSCTGIVASAYVSILNDHRAL